MKYLIPFRCACPNSHTPRSEQSFLPCTKNQRELLEVPKESRRQETPPGSLNCFSHSAQPSPRYLSKQSSGVTSPGEGTHQQSVPSSTGWPQCIVHSAPREDGYERPAARLPLPLLRNLKARDRETHWKSKLKCSPAAITHPIKVTQSLLSFC